MKKLTLITLLLISYGIKSQTAATANNQVTEIGVLRNVINTTSVSATSTVIGVSAGTITAGALRIDFLTNSAFTGSINGAACGSNTAIYFPNINYRTYPAMIYTVTTGSVNVNIVR